MARRYNAAVIGGGFDGLVAAAYLAKAGKSVVVLEASERIGGAVATDELPGGGLVPAAFGSVEMLHPAVVTELGLGAHGLERISAGGVLVVPADGAPPLHLDSRRGPIAAQVAEQASAADGAAYDSFERFHRRLASALEPTLTDVLPDPAPSDVAGVFQLVQLAWRLRRLGNDEMPEALRHLPMPLQDVLDERFTDERLKAALAGPALTASPLGPRSAGSSYGLLHHRPAWSPGLVAPLTVVAGGIGRLSETVAAAVTARGGEIRTGARVAAVRVGERGADGVVLDSGDEIDAGAVIAALDPKTTLLDLVAPEWLDPGTVRAIERIRGRGTVALVRYRLDRAPEIPGAPVAALDGRIQLGGATLDHLERAFDPTKYGRFAESPWVELTVPSALDPSLAPEGRHLAVAWVQYVPRHLRDRDWATARDLLAGRVTAVVEAAAPGFTASIEHRDVVTPEDLERRLGGGGGCLYQVDMTLDQLLHLRPFAGWYDHRTPVAGLWLCGPGCHPGGGVTGLPGRNAARAVVRG